MPCSTFLFRLMNRLAKIAIPCLAALFLGALYFRTLARGLSWAYAGADGGDLVTAAATGGVPHPTGYPTYLLLVSCFLKIPSGSFAYRSNLLSLVATILAALLIYKLVLASDGSVSSALIASLVFGTFPLVWSQAIITEVYALHAFLIVCMLYFFVVNTSHPFMDLLGGSIAGLAIGNHVTSIFMLPLMFGVDTHREKGLTNTVSRKRSFLSLMTLLAYRLIGFGLGLSVYLLIPIRARAQAPVNWGNANNLDGLIWLVTGQAYQSRLAHLNGSYLFTGVQAWSHFLLEQLSIVGLLLSLIVLAVLFRPSRLYIATGWMLLAYSVFSIVYYSPDSYVYLIPALIALSIWIGSGSRWFIERLSNKKSYLYLVALLIIPAFFVLRAILAIPGMDLSNDRTAEKFAQVILDAAPNEAIIISQGDEATFALWYFHYAYRQRPDIAIVSSDLLVQPWYHDVLKYTYPDLVVPDGPWVQDWLRANPQRSVCQVEPDLQPPVECSR